jgi:hypothetical protein
MSRDAFPRDSDDSRSEVTPSRAPSTDREDRQPDHNPDSAGSQDRARGQRTQQEQSRPDLHFKRGRAVLYDRDRGYGLRASEIRAISEIGKFRVIATRDLAEHAYNNRGKEMDADLQDLVRKGIVRERSLEGPEANSRHSVTLTRRGTRLVRANRLVPEGQAVYHGFVKPKEANHDADLYRLYQKEARRIEEKGGRNLRVILDFELKKKINRDIARSGAHAKPEIAARHGLSVVRNKIPIPDLQIEYETRDGAMARVNLELVTEHYRGGQVGEKVRAGFSIYTPHGEADRLRRVLDERELTAEILSL